MLADTEIRRAIREATAERTIKDHSQGRGAGSLRLRIRPAGKGDGETDKRASAVWLVAWKQGGERANKQLGRYPDMTAAEARRVYREEIVPKLLAGKDPRVTVTAAGKPTVEKLFEAYVQHMRTLERDSADEVERQLLKAKENAADALGRNRLAGDIEAGDVVEYLAKFHRRGHRSSADKCRSYIHSAFNWALRAANDYTVKDRQDWGIRANPVAAVARDKDATGKRTRNLSADELKVLWAETEPDTNGFSLETAGVIRLVIGTGQRVQEVIRMDGAEVDLGAALWTMPREKTKLKLREHKVPLPHQVVPILRQLVARHGAGPLFPARAGTKGERMDHRSVMSAIDRWRALPGVKFEHFQTRDLRRTWKSRTGEIGISREVRDLIQQHARNDTGSKHYDIADYLPQMRAGMDTWAAWLDDALGLKKPARKKRPAKKKGGEIPARTV